MKLFQSTQKISPWWALVVFAAGLLATGLTTYYITAVFFLGVVVWCFIMVYNEMKTVWAAQRRYWNTVTASTFNSEVQDPEPQPQTENSQDTKTTLDQFLTEEQPSV